ncbi:hypothetical protein ACQ4M4_06665 [Leptolyngbya sp. AN02str]|uniref:hypothetical protein n=1 Tax=Leptolyngbya sp. AN02str TaxID=3423363 RepID=UPI003D310D7A
MAQNSLYALDAEQLALLTADLTSDLALEMDEIAVEVAGDSEAADSSDLLQITRDMFGHTGTDQELLDRVVTAIEILCDRLNLPNDHVA